MAKGSNLITSGLRGKIGSFQLVKDPRYGEYLRCARGTFKPALLNEACQTSSKRMAIANAPAKAIYDALRNEHKDYFLWNKLVSVFRRQLKAGIPFHINDLKNMECHEHFTLDKLMVCTGNTVRVAEKADTLGIDILPESHPDWSHLKWKRAFQYRLSIIVVYPDLAGGSFIKETVHGPVTQPDSPVLPLSFDLPIPVSGGKYLVFLLATICEEGKAVELAYTRGMRVVGIGEIPTVRK